MRHTESMPPSLRSHEISNTLRKALYVSTHIVKLHQMLKSTLNMSPKSSFLFSLEKTTDVSKIEKRERQKEKKERKNAPMKRTVLSFDSKLI